MVFPLESWLSGRKRLTANEVGVLKPLEGSNPSLSALTAQDVCAAGVRAGKFE